MCKTPRLRRATQMGLAAPWPNRCLRSFLHDERNQDVGSHEMPKGTERTRQRPGIFTGTHQEGPNPLGYSVVIGREVPTPAPGERRWIMDSQDLEQQPFFSSR